MEKHYRLELGADIYHELEKTAVTREMSVAELLREFIKLGLVAVHVQNTPGSMLLLREGDHERELTI